MSTEKDRIADSFEKHFEHFGYKKTSVDDIAKELQISKKTIYQFFDSKEQIFYYIISRVARRYARSMEHKLSDIHTYRDKIAELVKMIFAETKKWTRQNDAFEFKYKYEIAELAFREAHGELVKKLVEAGMKNGEFQEAPVDLTMSFIQGILSESLRLVTVNQDLEIEEEVIAGINRLLN